MAAGCKPAAPCELRGFESSPVHQLILNFGFWIEEQRRVITEGWRHGRIEDPKSKIRGGSNSVVESQPSKLLVAGSIPVSRSSSKFENGNSKRGETTMKREFRFSDFEFRAPWARGPM